MNNRGESLDNLHIGSVRITDDLQVDGDMVIEGDIIFNGSITISPPSCLNVDCVEEITSGTFKLKNSSGSNVMAINANDNDIDVTNDLNVLNDLTVSNDITALNDLIVTNDLNASEIKSATNINFSAGGGASIASLNSGLGAFATEFQVGRVASDIYGSLSYELANDPSIFMTSSSIIISPDSTAITCNNNGDTIFHREAGTIFAGSVGNPSLYVGTSNTGFSYPFPKILHLDVDSQPILDISGSVGAESVTLSDGVDLKIGESTNPNRYQFPTAKGSDDDILVLSGNNLVFQAPVHPVPVLSLTTLVNSSLASLPATIPLVIFKPTGGPVVPVVAGAPTYDNSTGIITMNSDGYWNIKFQGVISTTIGDTYEFRIMDPTLTITYYRTVYSNTGSPLIAGLNMDFTFGSSPGAEYVLAYLGGPVALSFVSVAGQLYDQTLTLRYLGSYS